MIEKDTEDRLFILVMPSGRSIIAIRHEKGIYTDPYFVDPQPSSNGSVSLSFSSLVNFGPSERVELNEDQFLMIHPADNKLAGFYRQARDQDRARRSGLVIPNPGTKIAPMVQES